MLVQNFCCSRTRFTPRRRESIFSCTSSDKAKSNTSGTFPRLLSTQVQNRGPFLGTAEEEEEFCCDATTYRDFSIQLPAQWSIATDNEQTKLSLVSQIYPSCTTASRLHPPPPTIPHQIQAAFPWPLTTTTALKSSESPHQWVKFAWILQFSHYKWPKWPRKHWLLRWRCVQ